MRAIGYFRDLSGEPGRRGTAGDGSLAQQNNAFLEFCRREGYEPAATFIDAETGLGGAARPGFRQMLSFLQRPDKGFVVVVVDEIGRLGGDMREAARAFFQIESLGAQVAVMDRPGDSLPHLLHAWTNGAAQAGGAAGGGAGERIRAAMRKKAVKGEALGRPPYGYAVGPRRRLELAPEEAVVVRFIFRLYLNEGLGIRLIARRLNEEGLKTRRGGNWSMVTIRDLLRNRTYLGTYSRFGVRVPGSHPALVSPDDFRKVQDRMSARRTTSPGRRAAADEPEARPRTPFILSGLAYCDACGNHMIGVSRRQRWTRRTDGIEQSAEYRYYQCESRTNQSLCRYHTRRAQELEDEVRRAIVEGTAIRPVLRAGNEDRVRAEAEERCVQIRNRIALLDKRLDGYLQSATQGRMQKERLRGESTALARDRLALEDELADADALLRRQSDQAERQRRRDRDLDDVAVKWDDLRNDRKQALLRSLIDRIVVSDDAVGVHLRP